MARNDLAISPPESGQKVSYEEFLERYEGLSAEWVDGEVIVMSPVSVRHQDVRGLLYVLLGAFVETHKLGTVLAAPIQMRLVQRPSGREPDVLFLASQHQDRLLRNRVEGAAQLAVEVVSPDSVERDRQDKYAEYEAAGVQEYWLIDPDLEEAEFYRLGLGGTYELVPVGEDGVFRSTAVPGFWLHVGWLWEDPPRRMAALRELGL